MAYGIYDGTQVIAEFVAPITVRSNNPVIVSDSLSLKRSVTKRTAQRWEIETRLSPLLQTANDLFVHFVTKGFSETLQAYMPQNKGASLKLTATDVVTIYSAVAASSSQLPIKALSANNSKVLPKGTFIKFSNHNKVYMLTANVTLSGTLNTVMLPIYPALRSAVPANTTISYKDDVIFTCIYDTDSVQGMVYEDGILMDNGTIKLVEAL